MSKVIREILSSRSGRLSSKRVAGFIILLFALVLTIIATFTKIEIKIDVIEIIKYFLLVGAGLISGGVFDNIISNIQNKQNIMENQ